MDLSWLRPEAHQAVKSAHPGAGIELDDLVQIGALAALEAAAGHDASRGASLKSWQWKHAAWAMRDVIMVSARRHRVAPMDALGDSFDREDESPTPEMRAVMAQRRTALADALSSLPANQRQIIALIYSAEISGQEIARRNRVSEEFVSRTHTKTLRALRERLQEHA